MPAYPELIERLLEALAKFPGIGRKSAERILFYLLKADKQEVLGLSEKLVRLKEKIGFCRECHNLAEGPLCRICDDPGRDRSVLCVIEEPKDLIFLEKAGVYHGLYHVLLGYLSPLEGIGPKELRVDELFKRIEKLGTREVIIATNSHAEGETTALFLAEVLRQKYPELRATRIARGIPIGSQLEYLDPATLARAIEGRTAL